MRRLTQRVPRNRFGLQIGDAFRTKLRYSQVVTLAAANTRQVFSGNSVFDPDVTGTGFQPNYYDQIAALYGFYRVFWSSIRIQVVPLAAGAASLGQMSVYPSLAPNPFTTGLANNAGTRYSKSKLVTANTDKARLRHFMSTKRIYGDRTNIATEYSASVTTNPLAPWYWILDFMAVDGTTVQTSTYKVDLVYGVDFEGALSLPVS